MINISSSEMSRMFIALTPDLELNKTISDLKRNQKQFLNKEAKVNWSNDHQHHITINFIGSMEPEQKEEMFNFLDDRPPFKKLPIEVSSLGYFPNDDGKVLVVNINLSSRLKNLFNEVDKVVARVGFGMSLRSFKPHITLARFKDKKRPFSKLIELDDDINSIIKSLDVYESTFESTKTLHTLIKSYDFE